MLKKIAYGVIGVLLFAYLSFSVASFLSPSLGVTRQTAGAEKQKFTYEVFGSSTSSPSLMQTLSTSFSSVTPAQITTNFATDVHLDGVYVPTVAGAQLQVMVKTSNGDCTDFFPITTREVTSSTINIYTASATSGIPIVFPNGYTTVANVTTTFAHNQEEVGDCMQYSARTTSGTARLYLKVSGQSN